MFESPYSVILDFFIISLVSSQNVGSVILIDIYFLDKGSLIISRLGLQVRPIDPEGAALAVLFTLGMG